MEGVAPAKAGAELVVRNAAALAGGLCIRVILVTHVAHVLAGILVVFLVLFFLFLILVFLFLVLRVFLVLLVLVVFLRLHLVRFLFLRLRFGFRLGIGLLHRRRGVLGLRFVLLWGGICECRKEQEEKN